MSLTIFHGEHHVNSREALLKLVDQYRDKEFVIAHIDSASQLRVDILENEMGSVDLFAQPKVVVIEGLFSLQRSKKKDELIDLVLKYSEAKEIILWEAKKLTVPQLKKVGSAKLQLFALSSSLFEWLDTLQGSPQRKLSLLHTALQQDGAEFCFAMLARQVRLLIMVKAGGTLKEHPFVIKKVTAQARAFSFEHIKKLHEKLLTIDFEQKTGRHKLTLGQELEELMVRM